MNSPELPRIDFGLSPDKEIERFLKLQIQKRLIEMEIEVLKPNLVSQCEAARDGNIKHILGTLSARVFETWAFSPEVDQLSKQLKDQKAQEKDAGIATVATEKRSPVASINPGALSEALEIHFDDLPQLEDQDQTQDLAA